MRWEDISLTKWFFCFVCFVPRSDVISRIFFKYLSCPYFQSKPLGGEQGGSSCITQAWIRISSVQLSCSVVSDFLQTHEPQHTRPPCPSTTPGVYPNSCPLSRWCHPAISSSVVPFSSCLQSFPVSGSFQMSQFSASGGQSTGVSASTSVLLTNMQDWFPLGWTGWISLLSLLSPIPQFKNVYSLALSFL